MRSDHEPGIPATPDDVRRAAAAYCAAVEMDSPAVVERRATLDARLLALADVAFEFTVVDSVVRRVRRDSPIAAGWVLHDAGRRAADRGDTPTALSYFADAREVLVGAMPDLAAVALDTADLLIDNGDFEAAAFHLENARAYWTVSGSRAARADAGFMLGDVLVALHRTREAADAYATAAVDYERAGLDYNASRCRSLAASFTTI